MHDFTNASNWGQLASAVLIVTLGGLVASIRPRTRPNLAFAAFAVAFGGQFALTNVGFLFLDYPALDAPAWFEAPRALLRFATAAGVVALAFVLPTPLRRDEWRLLAAPVLVAGVAFVVGLPGISLFTSSTPGWIAGIGFLAFASALVGIQALWALRFRTARDERGAQHCGFLAGALLLYSGFTATAGFDGTRELSVLSTIPAVRLWMGVLVAGLLLVTVLWLRATTEGPARRTARNLALATPSLMLVGIAHAALGLTFGIGVLRILAVFVLAYAIVRHQLLGIDVKLRFAISKSTIAAVFIAVFFIAGEAAQQFFGETLESTYLGIAAAGMLVFAMAPLQRAAERFAERAVPVAAAAAPPGTSETVLDRRLESYRDAVRYTLRDGRMTPKEEIHLARLAADLGLPADRAVEIRHEFEREAAEPNKGGV